MSAVRRKAPVRHRFAGSPAWFVRPSTCTDCRACRLRQVVRRCFGLTTALGAAALLPWNRLVKDSTTKSAARPSSGRTSVGPTMDTSLPPARIRPADRFWISPPMTSNTDRRRRRLPARRCRGRDANMSGGLSQCRPLIIVDQVPPEAIHAAAQDIACRASDVHVLAVGTCAIN